MKPAYKNLHNKDMIQPGTLKDESNLAETVTDEETRVDTDVFANSQDEEEAEESLQGCFYYTVLISSERTGLF
jgi:hypothetical protein